MMNAQMHISPPMEIESSGTSMIREFLFRAQFHVFIHFVCDCIKTRDANSHIQCCTPIHGDTGMQCTRVRHWYFQHEICNLPGDSSLSRSTDLIWKFLMLNCTYFLSIFLSFMLNIDLSTKSAAQIISDFKRHTLHLALQ